MKITPVEITNKDFKRTMRGYSTDEVDEFLDDIVEDFEALYRENASLKEKIEGFNEKIQYYGNLEKTLQSTLILAQNTADATKNQAEKEAEHIIENAKGKAQAIIENTNKDNEQLKREYEKYRMEFSSFKMRVLNFMESQMGSFTSSSDEIERGTLGTTSLRVAGLAPQGNSFESKESKKFMEKSSVAEETDSEEEAEIKG
ncbi:MAG TPA: DivIVA domain-containing protein [Proteiniclasticum sp.]|nr:DivIVA domain-containing protein [Proteiniclasticum sp.]